MARRQKTAAENADSSDKAKDPAKTDSSSPTTKPEAARTEAAAPASEAKTAPAGDAKVAAPAKASAARPDPKELPAIEPPAPRAEPWPDATPQPMKPVQAAAPQAEPEPVRVSRAATVAMPVVADTGKPPEMPQSVAPPPLALGAVEDPTHMPGPKDVPAGSPDDPAPAPGRVPPGDSRSLRRGDAFALVYRVGTCVISRTGTVGKRGQWRVVEYPTSAMASNSYAKECSRFVAEGFSDYRD